MNAKSSSLLPDAGGLIISTGLPGSCDTGGRFEIFGMCSTVLA
jgi:hypothetical protein